jgi:hypothetical protein
VTTVVATAAVGIEMLRALAVGVERRMRDAVIGAVAAVPAAVAAVPAAVAAGLAVGPPVPAVGRGSESPRNEIPPAG